MENSADRFVKSVLELPIPIELEGAVAGSVTDAKIGGLAFDVIMPDLSLSVDELGYPLVVFKKSSLHSGDATLCWDNATDWREDAETAEDILTVEVERILLCHRLRAANEENKAFGVLEDVRRALLEDIDRWTTSLISWLEVGSGEPLMGLRWGMPSGNWLRVWGHDGARYVPLHSDPFFSSTNQNESVSLDTWQRAVHRASTGGMPPTEYVLLIDARRNLRNDDLRRAVLDAATGAEIALTRMLHARLASSPVVIANLVKDRWQQISSLTKALKRFDVTLPAGIDGESLAKPRNEAIHRGAKPTREQANKSIDIASKVIETALPLDSIF